MVRKVFMTNTVTPLASSKAALPKICKRVAVHGEKCVIFGVLPGLVVLLLFLSGVFSNSNASVPVCIELGRGDGSWEEAP